MWDSQTPYERDTSDELNKADHNWVDYLMTPCPLSGGTREVNALGGTALVILDKLIRLGWAERLPNGNYRATEKLFEYKDGLEVLRALEAMEDLDG